MAQAPSGRLVHDVRLMGRKSTFPIRVTASHASTSAFAFIAVMFASFALGLSLMKGLVLKRLSERQTQIELDTLTVNNLSGTDVKRVNVNIAGTIGGSVGDGHRVVMATQRNVVARVDDHLGARDGQ
jgi:hypothetical protein